MDSLILEEIRDRDLYKIVVKYGHGDCHYLTSLLIKKYQLEGRALFTQSGILIHSFVLLENGMAFDIYGINNIEKIKERYEKYSIEELKEDLLIKKIGIKELEKYAGFVEEYEEEYINEDLQIILKHLKIKLRK